MGYLDGGDLVVRALKQEAVDTIFTLCGGHVQAIYDACIDEGVQVIDVRHEQAAGHAAEGWSRATRRCGVAVVTAGPGVTDTVTAIANAYHNRSPVVIIAGRSPLSRQEMGALQEMDQLELVKSITVWARCVYETHRIPEYVAAAFRAATGRRGPAFLEIPTDLLFRKVEESQVYFPATYRPTGGIFPAPELIEESAGVMSKAERPLIIAGSEVYWQAAHDDLRCLAERLQAPVYLNGMGRGAIPQDHPLFFSRSRARALAAADAILIVGTPLDFRLGYGKRFNSAARLVQIDPDPLELGRNRDVDIPIQANAGAALKALSAEIGKQISNRREWLLSLEQEEEKSRLEMEPWLASEAVPIHPLRLCKEIAAFVEDETIVVGDGGDIVNFASKVLPINHPGQWYDPGPLGTLGCGTGFCMALQSVYPNRRILMINGDGSFGLNGFEFDTFVRFGLPIVSIIGNDRQWGQIAMGQQMMYGKDRVVASILADNAHYDRVVEALGGHGEFVTQPQDIRPAIERAIASGRPACVNVLTDPDPPGVKGGHELM